MRAVQVGEHRADLLAHHAQQRLRLRLDHGDVAADRPGGRGHLEPDPAAADDRPPAARSCSAARSAAQSSRVRR